MSWQHVVGIHIGLCAELSAFRLIPVWGERRHVRPIQTYGSEQSEGAWGASGEAERRHGKGGVQADTKILELQLQKILSASSHLQALVPKSWLRSEGCASAGA